MAANTERIIMGTFEQLLAEKPFYKITVSELVKRCGISPNTFYYHYEDIYDLLESWFEIWLSQFSIGDDWRVNAKIFLHECQDNKTVIYHILNYLSKDQIEQVIFNTTEDDIFYSGIKKSAEGMNIPEYRLHNIADFCRYAFIGFFLQFIWEHLEADIDQTVDDLDLYMRIFIKSALEAELAQAQSHQTSDF